MKSFPLLWMAFLIYTISGFLFEFRVSSFEFQVSSFKFRASITLRFRDFARGIKRICFSTPIIGIWDFKNLEFPSHSVVISKYTLYLMTKKSSLPASKLEFGIFNHWNFNFNQPSYQTVLKINIFICLKNAKKLVKSELLS